MYAQITTSSPAHEFSATWDARWSYGSGSPVLHVDLGLLAHLALDLDGAQLLADVLQRACAAELGQHDGPR